MGYTTRVQSSSEHVVTSTPVPPVARLICEWKRERNFRERQYLEARASRIFYTLTYEMISQ